MPQQWQIQVHRHHPQPTRNRLGYNMRIVIKENLKILCPNCHSQTHTWRGRNSNNSKRKHDIDLIIQVFKRTGNIHKTLIELNMAPKGANYDTIKKILIKNKIEF